MSPNQFKLGIDLGGTKISGIVLQELGSQTTHLTPAQVCAYKRVDTPQGDYAATLNAVLSLVNDLQTQVSEKCSIGIGTPGSVSPLTGVMRNCNSTCLNGKPLVIDLENALKQPIRQANDADCMLLSEAYDGAAKDAEMVFGVILGTGVGGALVYQKNIIQGPNRITGEWGHNPLPRFNFAQPGNVSNNALQCYCGKTGCIETYLSGEGLARRYRSESISAITVHQRMQQGDIEASRVLQEYVDDLAQALTSVINVIDPDAIVLAGGLSQITPLYALLSERINDHIFSDVFTTPIVPALHGPDSGVRGAARLWDAVVG